MNDLSCDECEIILCSVPQVEMSSHWQQEVRSFQKSSLKKSTVWTSEFRSARARVL